MRDTVGVTAYGHVGDNNDAGMLDLSTSKYKNPAELSTWGADATGPDLTTKGVGNFTQDDGIPLQVWDASDVTIGMPACKSGSTSGWTCGVVTADKVTESVNDNGELLDVYGLPLQRLPAERRLGRCHRVRPLRDRRGFVRQHELLR